MQRIDRDIHLCRALVIDSNANTRSVLVGQLRDFGVGTVTACGRVAEARSQLEAHTYDIVLCEQGFSGTEYSGQQLLDDLRRSRLLPLSTVFIMITAEASYAKVLEAAESALDGYLLKPHTASALGERVTQSRRRKKALKDIFDAIDAGRHLEAAALCRARFDRGAEYGLYAARIGTELLLQQGRHAEAGAFYAAIAAKHAVPWALLGVARAQLEGGHTTNAVETLDALMTKKPNFVELHDVLGQARLQLGQLDAAGTAFRQAAQLTPGSVDRLQKFGIHAYYAGEYEDAARALERATAVGLGSKMYDHQTCTLLALTRFHLRDTKGLQRCAEQLSLAQLKASQDTRLRRLSRVAATALAMAEKRMPDVAAALKAWSDDLSEPSFDLEAAMHLVALLSHLCAAGHADEVARAQVEAVARRHCTGKVSSEWLLRSARAHAPFSDVLKQGQQSITHIMETAMHHSIAGDPGQAVRLLLDQGRETLNAKLIDTARLVLQRHGEKLANAVLLQSEVEELRMRYASAPPKLPLTDGHGRTAGGMALRTAAKPAPAAQEPRAAA